MRSSTTGAAARGRAALVLALVGLAALLAATSTAPSMAAESVVVLAGVAAATTLVGAWALLGVFASRTPALRPVPGSADVPLVLAGRTTDVVHHPVRPRAPGLV